MNPAQIYRELALAAELKAPHAILEEVLIGLTWTACRVDGRSGLAMTPEMRNRTLPWPGSLVGRPLTDVCSWLTSWNPFETAVALAAVNAALGDDLATDATCISPGEHPNIALFQHLTPLMNGKVVVVGRNPHLAPLVKQHSWTVLERDPSSEDLPDPAAEFVIPEADWVLLTASSLVNKTAPRLLGLAQGKRLVLMGPSAPWWNGWGRYGVTDLAGVVVQNPNLLRQVVVEGGGAELFRHAVHYRLLSLNPLPSSA